MAISAAQQKQLAAAARRANRRLERATAGQRAYLEKQIAKYHTRQRPGGMTVFQQGKAKSAAEYRARMRELEAFLKAETSRRKGWKAVKKKQIESTGEKLRAGGSNLTDAEIEKILTDEQLANTLRELEAAKDHAGRAKEFYRALTNVEIAKARADDSWTGSEKQITAALDERYSAQERTAMLLRLRNKGG